MIPIHVSYESSERAEKLGRRLADTINTFRRENGELKPGELRQALHLAAERTAQPAPRAVMGMLLGIMIAGGLSAYLLSGREGRDAPVIAVTLTIAAVLFVFFLLVRRK